MVFRPVPTVSNLIKLECNPLLRHSILKSKKHPSPKKVLFQNVRKPQKAPLPAFLKDLDVADCIALTLQGVAHATPSNEESLSGSRMMDITGEIPDEKRAGGAIPSALFGLKSIHQKMRRKNPDSSNEDWSISGELNQLPLY